MADQSQRFGVDGEAGGLDDAGGLRESVSGLGQQRVGVRGGVALPRVPRFHRSGTFLLTRPQVRGRDLMEGSEERKAGRSAS